MDVANNLGVVVTDYQDFTVLGYPDDGHKIDAWGVTGDAEVWIPFQSSGYVIGGLEGAWVEDNDSFKAGIAGEFSGVQADLLRLLPLDGGQGDHYICGASMFGQCLLDGSANSQFYRAGGFAGVGTDAGTNGRIGIGGYVAYSSLDFDSSYVVTDVIADAGGNIGASVGLDEHVTTWSDGPIIAGETRHALSPGVGVFLKGRLAALYANGDLDARQATQDLNSPNATPDPQLSVSDNEHAFAGLAEAEVGVDVMASQNLMLSIFGGASWRNDVFRIENPSPELGVDINCPSVQPCEGPAYDGVAAHLVQTDLITYTVGGAIEVTW